MNQMFGLEFSIRMFLLVYQLISLNVWFICFSEYVPDFVTSAKCLVHALVKVELCFV